jgi:DNA polymerase-3 subunit alpha/DNA polymerase-3 subunit epsilon
MDEYFFLGGLYKSDHAYCSDNQCPCPQVRISRGQGYIFVEQYSDGTFHAQLTCEEGARLRNLDLDIARKDAQRWWSTGMVPKRVTPKSAQKLQIIKDEAGYRAAEEYRKQRLEKLQQILGSTKGDYVFFDTETTGLPKRYDAPASDLQNWPRIVQLSWIVSDGHSVLKEEDHIIKPDGFIIPMQSSSIHGITQQVAMSRGEQLQNVLAKFLADVNVAKFVIGHNIDFDVKVVQSECIRYNCNNPFLGKKVKDTMKMSTDYCKIPGAYGYKWPKLSELYRKLFGRDFSNAHNSMADIKATFDCYKQLVNLNIM